MKKLSKFAGEATIYTVSNFSVAGIPFLLMPIMTRILSPEDYGFIAMFAVVVSFLVAIAGLNTHGAVMVRYFEPEKFYLPQYVSTILIILCTTTCLLMLSAWVFSEKLASVTALSTKWLILAVVVASLQFLIQVLLTLWQSTKQPIKYGLLRFSQAILDGGFSLFFIMVLLLSWEGRLFGVVIAAAITSIAALYWLRREGWLQLKFSLSYAKDALRFGIPLMPHAIGGVVLGVADRFMVTNYLDVASTGIYLVAIQIGLILGISADAFNKAYAPWLIGVLHSADLAQKKRIVNFTYLYFLLITAFALLGSLCAPWLLRILVGQQYQTAASFVMYTLLGNAFTGMYYMVTNYIFFVRRTELLSSLTISVGLMTVALSWYLIQKNGLEGAAQAFMCGQALLFFGAWALAQYCHEMPWLDTLKPGSAATQ